LRILSIPIFCISFNFLWRTGVAEGTTEEAASEAGSGANKPDEDPNHRVSLTRRLSRVFVMEGEVDGSDDTETCIPGTSGTTSGNNRSTVISLDSIVEDTFTEPQMDMVYRRQVAI
jgi:hypothetical protein